MEAVLSTAQQLCSCRCGHPAAHACAPAAPLHCARVRRGPVHDEQPSVAETAAVCAACPTFMAHAERWLQRVQKRLGRPRLKSPEPKRQRKLCMPQRVVTLALGPK